MIYKSAVTKKKIPEYWIRRTIVENQLLSVHRESSGKIEKIKENEVLEDVMKMEVLSVQNQFQGQFGMIGSTKVRGKFNAI